MEFGVVVIVVVILLLGMIIIYACQGLAWYPYVIETYLRCWEANAELRMPSVAAQVLDYMRVVKPLHESCALGRRRLDRSL